MAEPFIMPPNQQCGRIEVICGPMFSGKTEELLRRLRRAQIARQKVAIFKPTIDNRYSEKEVVSHDAQKIAGTTIEHIDEIPGLLDPAVRVVGIDEAQFLKGDLAVGCQRLAYDGRRVIAAGLDMDFMGRPFGTMPRLLAVAEFVTKLQAICMVSGGMATHSYRKAGSNEEQIMVGENDLYEARGRQAFADGLRAQGIDLLEILRQDES